MMRVADVGRLFYYEYPDMAHVKTVCFCGECHYVTSFECVDDWFA